jgi:hypothetical protein
MYNPLWIIAAIIHSAVRVPRADLFSASDPYVVLRVHAQSDRTPTIQDNASPRWDAALHIITRDSLLTDLRIELWDEDIGTDDLLAVGTLTPEQIKDASIRATLPLVLLPQFRLDPAGPPTLSLSYGLMRAYAGLLDRLRGVRGVIPDDDSQTVCAPVSHAAGLWVIATYSIDSLTVRAVQALTSDDAPDAPTDPTFLELLIANHPLTFTQRSDPSRPWRDAALGVLVVAEAVAVDLHPSLPLEHLWIRRLTVAPVPEADFTAAAILADAGWPDQQPLRTTPYAAAKTSLSGALLDDLNHCAYIPLPDALFTHDFDAVQSWLFTPSIDAPGTTYYTLRAPADPASPPDLTSRSAAATRVHFARPRRVMGFNATQSLHPQDPQAPLRIERHTLRDLDTWRLLDHLPLRDL